MADESREPPVTIEEEAMEQKVRSKPKINHLVPTFMLQSVKGDIISPWQYKEKKNLVMLFFDPRSSSDLAILAEFKRRYHDIADDNGEVLAIATGPPEELKECVASMDFPFPLLSDSDDRVREEYGVSGPTIFVADKFGELKMQSAIGDDVDSIINAALSVLDLIELECPECGVASWPQE